MYLIFEAFQSPVGPPWGPRVESGRPFLVPPDGGRRVPRMSDTVT